MNIKLIKCEIKWFWKLRIWQKIKKWTWCVWKHNRCYPRDPNGYWHCKKCFPCGICFCYFEEKLEAQSDV